jgi:hypothetical protein
MLGTQKFKPIEPPPPAFNDLIAFISLYGIIAWLDKWWIFSELTKRGWLPVLRNVTQRAKASKNAQKA